jgi:hypothetical protein
MLKENREKLTKKKKVEEGEIYQMVDSGHQ